jgi:PspC domain
LKHEHNHRRRRVRHRYRPAPSSPAAPVRPRHDAGRRGRRHSRYLNADVTLVRVSIAALVLFTSADVALYVAAWLLIPEDGEDQPVAAAWIVGRQDRIR